jgi:hypothetical protein
LWMHLASYPSARTHGVVWPGVASLAQEMGCDVRSVKRQLAELRDDSGHLATLGIRPLLTSVGTSQWRTTVYRLNPPQPKARTRPAAVAVPARAAAAVAAFSDKAVPRSVTKLSLNEFKNEIEYLSPKQPGPGPGRERERRNDFVLSDSHRKAWEGTLDAEAPGWRQRVSAAELTDWIALALAHPAARAWRVDVDVARYVACELRRRMRARGTERRAPATAAAPPTFRAPVVEVDQEGATEGLATIRAALRFPKRDSQKNGFFVADSGAESTANTVHKSAVSASDGTGVISFDRASGRRTVSAGGGVEVTPKNGATCITLPYAAPQVPITQYQAGTVDILCTIGHPETEGGQGARTPLTV